MKMLRHFVLPALLLVLLVEGATQTRGVATPTYGYEIVDTYRHDTNSFTQGLIFLDGTLYESTGPQGNSQSRLRRIQLDTGRVLQEYLVPREYFAEGMTNWNSDLIQLTWKSKIGFVYDRATFRIKRTFEYKGEGWGLTHDGARLIMSDGTPVLRFLDPKSFQETGRITVRDRGQTVKDLNELEMVQGEIYANVWHTDRIARISPRTGEVTGWIDLQGLRKMAQGNSNEAVLNGIAYDAASNRLFVTGKLWAKVFEIRVGRAR
jgi:glutaminyl-peptide cyclotransferase